MGTFIDLTGKRYGHLMVIRKTDPHGKSKAIRWICQCDCGNITETAGYNLRNGHTTSCGCQKRANSLERYEDLTGQKFGKLTVIKHLKPEEREHQSRGLLCQCECGNIVQCNISKLKTGHTTSCGCRIKENKGANFEDLTGQKFGRLTVIRWLEKSDRKTRQYNWLCKCDCGNEVIASANKLKTGLQVSCGCRKHENDVEFGQRNRKYIYTYKRLYSVYKAIVDRCCNPDAKQWDNYGGREITICDEWLGENGYDNFALWAMTHGYDPEADQGECTIDRKDNDGNYEPDNCRWITAKEQANNKRTNIYIEYEGEVHTMAEWSEILDIPYRFLHWRMRRASRIRTLQECINEYNQQR